MHVQLVGKNFPLLQSHFAPLRVSLLLLISGVRLKSGCETLLLNGEGDDGGANSALLYYQITRPTKLSLASFNQVIGLV